jgi:hypothetical protein
MELARLEAEAAAVLLVLPRIGLIDFRRSTVTVEIGQSTRGSTTPYMKIRFFWCCDRTHKLSGSGLGPAEVPQSDFSLKAGSPHMNKILKFEF